MRKILFVDDDPNVIKQFKRVLHEMNQEWQMEFVNSGAEALNLLSRSSFDVIASDIHMPEMDGRKLLDSVRKCYPSTVRIILSENRDKETVLKSAESAHQFLMKSCEAETIKYTIERSCKLKDLLKNETLIKLITGIKDLPSVPSLYRLIVKEMQSPDASLKKVGYIISQDISMSAKILQFVNSAYFGLPHKILDPQKAAVYLGIETLKALVLSTSVFASLNEEADLCDFSLPKLWKHSLMTGSLAKEIVCTELNDSKLGEEALIAGILHDIGKLILLKMPDQYREIKEYVENNGFDFVDAEYEVLKISHAELGAYLLGLWGLPDTVVEAVAFHHNPSKLLENINFIPNQLLQEEEDKKRKDGSGIKLQSNETLLRDFATLSEVHIANALMMQKSSSFDSANFPYVDMQYLRKLNLTDRLPVKIECYNKIMRKEI